MDESPPTLEYESTQTRTDSRGNPATGCERVALFLVGFVLAIPVAVAGGGLANLWGFLGLPLATGIMLMIPRGSRPLGRGFIAFFLVLLVLCSIVVVMCFGSP